MEYDQTYRVKVVQLYEALTPREGYSLDVVLQVRVLEGPGIGECFWASSSLFTVDPLLQFSNDIKELLND